MMNGGHSRHSWPLDKMLPKKESRIKDQTSAQNQVDKKMHKKKQRDFNKKRIKEDVCI